MSKNWWEQTREEQREEFIQKLVQAGVRFSKHCRNCWTGERIRAYLPVEKFSGNYRHLICISSLPRGKALIDYANVADLHGFYLGREDQHLWDAKKWEKEIRERMGD